MKNVLISFSEVCNSANLPEVEIFSLIEEQIPKYRLRSDTITDFCGYENEDWIQTPLIPIDEDLELSTEQIDETLKYFGKYVKLVSCFDVCCKCVLVVHWSSETSTNQSDVSILSDDWFLNLVFDSDT